MSDRYDRVAQRLQTEQSSYLRKVAAGRRVAKADPNDPRFSAEAETVRQAKAAGLEQYLPADPTPSGRTGNLTQADKTLGLTKQEEGLYKHHLSNLYGNGKVMNSDGSVSTVYSITETINGKVYTLPTVWGGKILEPDAAVAHAQKVGLEKFPSYATPEKAMARYQEMHQFMEKDTSQYLSQQKASPSFKSITGATPTR
jgi:hypothetical protein